MFGHQFYHGTIRKYIIMFGNMFNDINIDRFDKSGNIIQSLNVPIAYGPREKFLARLREDPNLNQEVATILPRLSFEITNISYDQARTINKMHNISSRGAGADVLASTSTPIPYDINITLNGMFATNEDAVQVVEQVLPFFRPEWTHSLRLVDDLPDHYIDVPTILNDMSITDSYDSDFETRRAIIYTFNFTVKGYLYGPVKNRGVIKRTIANLYEGDNPATDEKRKSIDLEPGLKSDGTPTTDRTESIDRNKIQSEDDYGYAFDNETFFTGE
jgi:hypothetical protein